MLHPQRGNAFPFFCINRGRGRRIEVGRSSSRKLAIRAMSADVLELVFTGLAVLGTSLLLLSSIGGGTHVRVHIPMRLPHLRVPFVHIGHADDATAVPMLLGFLAMFGIGGLFGAAAFGLGPVGRTVVALLFGTCGAAGAFAIFAALRRGEGRGAAAPPGLFGRRARGHASTGASAHRTGGPSVRR